MEASLVVNGQTTVLISDASLETFFSSNNCLGIGGLECQLLQCFGVGGELSSQHVT